MKSGVSLEVTGFMTRIAWILTQKIHQPAILRNPFIRIIRRWLRTASIIRKLAGDLQAYWRSGTIFCDSDREYRCLMQRFQSGIRDHQSIYLRFDTEAMPPVMEAIKSIENSVLITSILDWHEVKSALHDNELTFVMCTGIERLQNPAQVIAEIRQKMALGGQIWIEAPFNTPYLPEKKEYWRFSPVALQALMLDFDEIFCSIHQVRDSFLHTISFFYGMKRIEDQYGDHRTEKWTQDRSTRHLKSVPNTPATMARLILLC